MSTGRWIAACVGVIALVLVVLALASVAAVPAWIAYALIGGLAAAVVIG